ncbi:replication protein 15 [Citrobacter portucalensis]|uniref:replication protein 15 n=1 Tax=Citrobacter portucalensis TaxID=1639133 RepID=UPI00333A5342
MTSRIFEIVQSMSGQGNSITIPCPYLDFFAGDQQAHLLAAILNQLVFWSGKSELSDGWFYKSYESIAREIHAVTKDQVRKAINKLETQYLPDIIETTTRKVNGAPTRHYRIHGDALIARLFPPTLEVAELPHGNGEAATSETAELPHGNGNTATSMEVAKLPHGNGNTATSFLYTDLKTTDLKDKKISMSENSGESSDREKTEKFLSRHPDAAVYTPGGKSWGTQADLDCAAWIFERVKIINPTQRQPNWTEWANDVRLIRQIDGFTHKEICKLFKRANQDSFWRSNILCPSKLREKWDTLTAKFQTGEPQHVQNTGESTATRQIREALDRWEQGDSPAAMGGDGENLRATVDCEEWGRTGRTLDGADWQLDQRPDDERLQLPR